MTTSPTQTSQEQINNRLSSLRRKVQDLQSRARLATTRDRVEDLSTLVFSLLPCVRDLRKQGYVFGKGYETNASSLAGQWRPLRDDVMREIGRQAPQLERELNPLESRLSQVQGRVNNPAAIQVTVDRLEKEINAFDDKVRAVEKSINGMYDSFSARARELKTELDRLDWMLQQFSAASFRLLPAEGALMAAKATYSKDQKIGKDDAKGILYLTDQRLFFEQKQEIATKKVLFITTEKEMIQKLLLEIPVELVDKVQASKKGLFGHQDHLEMTFKPGAAVQAAWLHIDGQDCQWWQGLIGRARSHEFDNERAVAVDADLIDKARSAPGQCPNCGAPMDQVVLRGMDSIRCEYCQYVIRL